MNKKPILLFFSTSLIVVGIALGYYWGASDAPNESDDARSLRSENDRLKKQIAKQAEDQKKALAKLNATAEASRKAAKHTDQGKSPNDEETVGVEKKKEEGSTPFLNDSI